ncbi:MAG: alpha/beta hydrolase [Myxococcaceae bacterium]
MREFELCITLFALLSASSGSEAATPSKPGGNLVVEEFKVPSDSGIDIFVRNKRASTMTSFDAKKTVLFIHGVTGPSESTFDLSLGGFSWMDFIADDGYDVYLMDVRGYGRSTRPPQMSLPPNESAPVSTTAEAVRDLAAVVEFIKHRRSIDKVNVLAWSWGTLIAQWYAAKNSNSVNKLVLYGPLWIRQTPSTPPPSALEFGAYRFITAAELRADVLTGVPEDKKANLIPDGWVDTWTSAQLDTDPEGWQQNPPAFRAPNGGIFDVMRYQSGAAIPFDVKDIRVPVLLINAEWDTVTPSYMAQSLFLKLVNSPSKRYIELGEGTHTVDREKNRMTLLREVQCFLNEQSPTAK